MIRSLRKRHRKYAIVLAIFPLSALAIGLAVRPQEKAVNSLPGALAGPSIKSLSQVRELGMPWENLAVKADLAETKDGQLGLKLSVIDELLKPDLLVYWIPEKSTTTPPDEAKTILPASAIFLGSFTQTTPSFLPLPKSIGDETGRLIFYSLPYQEVVERSNPISLSRE